MKSKKTIVRELKSLVGLMRLGLLLAAMVLTAGCSGGGDDPDSSGSGSGSGSGPVTPEENKTPIVFSALQQEIQDVTRSGHEAPAGTRAPIPLEEQGVTTFSVWGYKNKSYDGTNGYLEPQIVFPGYIVNHRANTANTTLSNSSDWEYVNQQLSGSSDEQTIKYWDWSVAAYRFFGVTHAGQVEVTEESMYCRLSFTVNTKSLEQCPLYSHLWFSNGNTAQGQKPFGQPVQLEFLKPYATVRYWFVSADPSVDLDDLNIESSAFKPYAIGRQISVKGEFAVTYPLQGTALDETWESNPGSEGGDKMTSFTSPKTDNVVLPVRNQGAFELTVYVSGDERSTYVPSEFMDWLPGYEYTYIFKVNKDGGVELGEVISAYKKWEEEEGQNVDHTVYNW
ncbi:MAG: fimbrillin family protein [Prevotella sp.]|nr:fimbrillin family protein [Prevotella sp.]MBR2205014.1 fimbrillin family protein [Prevotella sp.]